MIIAHASEYLTTADPAFVQAVGFAAASGAVVRGIHIARGPATEPTPPSARGLLVRWGRGAVEIDHAWRVSEASDDVADALLDVITAMSPDLLVVTFHARLDLERLWIGSVSEGVARNCASPVLFVPHHGPFLVSAQTGVIALDRALLVGGPNEDARRAAAALVMLAKLARVSPCTVELLHVEAGTPPPHPILPPGFDVIHHRARGPLERAVTQAVLRFDPQLIGMTSHGHDQLSDVLFASHTERVLHAQRRPLLWVPVTRPALAWTVPRPEEHRDQPGK